MKRIIARMRRQGGYNHLAHMLIVLVLLSIVSGAGVLVVKNQPQSDTPQSVTPPPLSVAASPTTTPPTAVPVTWQFNGSAWTASGTPPACSSPLLPISPVDINKATSILYPGQYRGGNYKAHGGFRFDNNTNNDVTVRLPISATLVSGSRYIEAGSTQYLLDFTADCGIGIRFDHLLTLSDTLQKLVNENLPAAKQDDSRGTHFPAGIRFAAGDTIASAIGNPNPPLNVGVDFGVYDYRQPNEASKSLGFHPAGTSASQANYGICWLHELPAADSTKALALPAGDQQQGKTSDYCK